ncbi:MAG TPA: DUF4242 domain-containing protein [Ferruginibacter sp.]|nr:DUF4242 domain-containing protein [Ferruginibacter sp.]
MKCIANRLTLLITIILFTGYASMAQTAKQTDNSKTQNATEMKTYLIEREIPDAGKFTAEQLKGISQKSCSVLTEMGPDIQWLQSYVTGNKIYCIYKAKNAELIKEHAKKGGFPANNIVEVGTVISPATAK